MNNSTTEIGDLSTTQISTLSTVQIGTLTEDPKPEEKKPLTIEEAIKGEVIKAAMLMFPGFGMLAQAINIAKKEGCNIIIPLIFAADGRVLINEPIVHKAEPVVPVPEGAGGVPKSDGDANQKSQEAANA